MFRILLRADIDFVSTMPAYGKLYFFYDHMEIEYFGNRKSYRYSDMDTVCIEKFLSFNFSITVKLKKSGRNTVSFSCYGHTNEVYERISERIRSFGGNPVKQQ